MAADARQMSRPAAEPARTGFFHTVEKTAVFFHGVENRREGAVDEVKWAWVLFVAATLALLVRLAMWFLPAPGWRAQQVAKATEPASVDMPATPESVEPAEVDQPEPRPETRIEWRPPPPEASTRELEPPPPPAPPPEEFHLRRIRWGMTLQEVQDAEPDAPLRVSDLALLYLTTTHDLPCLLTYSFSSGRLIRAQLAFTDATERHLPPLSVAQAQRRFLYLRGQLRDRYGDPIEKTITMRRDVSDLHRKVQKQEELARQYDVEIAEAEERIQKQRQRLESRFARWPNKSELVARGLAPAERDLRELRQWKEEALAHAVQSRQDIQQRQQADTRHPLIVVRTARWPGARDLHDIELKLDFRFRLPRLTVRYDENRAPPSLWPLNEL